MNGIISYIHTGTVACRQLSTSNNYGGKIQLPERKAGLSDRQFKDICQAVLNKPLNKYVSFIINYGDYIQLYTIYIKQKPDND